MCPDSNSIEAGKGTVLVVDDCDTVLAYVQRALGRFGYDVCACETGTKALEVYKERADIDLVILDMVMPEEGGEIVFRKLKEIDPEAKVVVASAYSVDGVVAECVDGGAVEFLNKPYDLNQLLEAVAKWVGRK